MKSAFFDPSEYSFMELAMANNKSAYQVAYDQWIAVYGSYLANLSSYRMMHGLGFMLETEIKEARDEAKRVANLAVGLKND